MHNKIKIVLCLIASLSLWGCPDDEKEPNTPAGGMTPMGGAPMGGDPNPMGGDPNPMGGDPNPMGGDPNPMGGDPNPMGGDPVGGDPVGGEPVGGEPADTTPPAELIEQVETFASRICELQLLCPEQGDFDYFAVFSQEDCERVFRADLLEDVYEGYALSTEGRVVYNELALDCFTDLLETILSSVMSEGCPNVNIEAEIDGAGCEDLNLYDGITELGESCQVDLDCAGDAYCEYEDICDEAQSGVCTSWEEEPECSTDEECVMSYGDGWVCVEAGWCDIPPVQEGESCVDSYCADGLYCNGEDVCAPLVRLAEGEVCINEDEERLCERGLVCSVLNEGQCQAPGAQGEACTFSGNTFSFSTCGNGLYCEGLQPESGSMGVCQPAPQEGDPCGEGVSLVNRDTAGYCPITMACVNDVCVSLLFYGEACTVDEECESGRCDEGRCGFEDYYCEEG